MSSFEAVLKTIVSLLADPAWSALAASFSVIIIFLQILKVKQTKEIAYSVIFNAPVVHATQEDNQNLQITYRGRPVSDVRLVIVKIWNSGNVPVLAEDYLSPIKISFGDKAEVLDTQISDTMPDGIEASLDIPSNKQDEIKLNLPLLNRKDYITLKFIVANFKGSIQINARISGIKQIHGIVIKGK